MRFHVGQQDVFLAYTFKNRKFDEFDNFLSLFINDLQTTLYIGFFVGHGNVTCRFWNGHSFGDNLPVAGLQLAMVWQRRFVDKLRQLSVSGQPLGLVDR